MRPLYKVTPVNLDEVKQCCREKRIKIQVIVAKGVLKVAQSCVVV